MIDFDLLLEDRLDVIKKIDVQFDLNTSAYLSFSGGKDSTCLHYLLDLALPGNRIPRVFIDTGMEYSLIRSFVMSLAAQDDRFVCLRSGINIKAMLDTYGYPFKSKEHSLKVGMYQEGSRCSSVMKYKDGDTSFSCPKCLKYQFDESFSLHLSRSCCFFLKKKPLHQWQISNNRSVAILGLRMSEGGLRRNHSGCVIKDKDGSLRVFKPLNPCDDSFIDAFVERFGFRLCDLYYPPYNFKRTGCKGCPFALDLQRQLDLMEKFFPAERKQCEVLWRPVYDEYRRIGYRLKECGHVFE